MKIAVASGKGGTGKTFVTVNLARSIGTPVAVLDCDVEAPNSSLFLRGEFVSEQAATLLIPRVNEELCDGCRVCADVCEFNAIAVIAGTPLIFEDLCHGCGACARFCPQGAITEVPHKIGMITVSASQNITLVEGRLDVGKALSVPVIRQVKAHEAATKYETILLDAPPGTSCPVVWTLSGCDAVVLVAEPTPFGLHDLEIAVETAQEIGIPLGVVINKDGLGDDRVLTYCNEKKIPILGKIKHDRRIAETYARGGMIVEEIPEYQAVFSRMWDQVQELATAGGKGNV
ncbi:MAG: ATP-binding protein [Sphaerochaetaceae bacterium]|nr:ATP-binding protein [Sphaerochaetaceae bacterium]